MIKVATYCRVSTDKDDQANSFETQQRYFQEYIERKDDWELYAVYADEGITGTNTKKRVRFNQMISDASEGKFELIITKEVSRFSRNILDTIAYTRKLKAFGVAVMFIMDGINTMDPDAELRLSIMASIAQEESRRTSSRVTWGQTRQMEKGVVFGPSMLGYNVKDGQISVNPEGAETVKLIFQKYTMEQVSTMEIARFLTKHGYRTYKGNSKWAPNTVIKILSNEKYVGDLVQKKTYTPDYLTHEKRKNNGEVPLIRIENHHKPIISREVWALAQERLKRNDKHRTQNSGHSNRYIFSGKINCSKCGAVFVGRVKKLADGTIVRRWSCGTAVRDGTSACNIGKLVRDDDAVHMLKIAIQSLRIDRQSIVSNIATLALDAILKDTRVTDNPERLRAEIDRIQQKKEAAIDSYFEHIITKEDLQSIKRNYEQQQEVLCGKLEKAEIGQKIGRNTEQLKNEIQLDIISLLCGERESDVLYKTILANLTVFYDRHLELRLSHLPQVFRFIE